MTARNGAVWTQIKPKFLDSVEPRLKWFFPNFINNFEIFSQSIVTRFNIMVQQIFLWVKKQNF